MHQSYSRTFMGSTISRSPPTSLAAVVTLSVVAVVPPVENRPLRPAILTDSSSSSLLDSHPCAPDVVCLKPWRFFGSKLTKSFAFGP